MNLIYESHNLLLFRMAEKALGGQIGPQITNCQPQLCVLQACYTSFENYCIRICFKKNLIENNSAIHIPARSFGGKKYEFHSMRSDNFRPDSSNCHNASATAGAVHIYEN